MNKFFKFEKSKFPVMKSAFILLILFSLFSIFSNMYFSRYQVNIPSYARPIEDVSLNVTLKNNTMLDLSLCVNDFCKVMENGTFYQHYNIRLDNLYPEFREDKINTISLLTNFPKEKLIKNIDNVDLHIGTKDYFFTQSDISEFEVKKVNVSFEKKRR